STSPAPSSALASSPPRPSPKPRPPSCAWSRSRSMTDSDLFAALYGHPPRASASAPGRVNLIGEHPDYHDGFALPMALPHRTCVLLSARDDRQVRAASAQVRGVHLYALGEEARAGIWLDYIQGITAALAEAAQPIAGFDLYVRSDVPVGAGLSSSA